MDPKLTDNDVQLMLAEIQRFCRSAIQPLVERPEVVIEPDQMDRLTRQAIELGLVNLTSEPGAGLWEHLESSPGLRLSLGALKTVAQVNAGIAFHFHQLAVGSFLSRCLPIQQSEPTIACVQGSYGLARGSLARLLQKKDLSDEDSLVLQDYFLTLDGPTENRPLMFQAADGWQQLLVPCLDSQQQIAWALFQRDHLQASPLPDSHGLNETLTWQWQYQGESPEQLICDGDRGLTLYNQALNIHAQALLAIALGTLRQGYDRAVDYASLRVQGGKPIHCHAAVRQMLASCSSTIQMVEFLCERLAGLALAPENLGKVLSIRAQVHNRICAAANDALQVFGGIGYMRETGLEKIVRDNNHLRLLCGTPNELLLFLAEWENEA